MSCHSIRRTIQVSSDPPCIFSSIDKAVHGVTEKLDRLLAIKSFHVLSGVSDTLS